jgi:uncharacterized damage-inducible protein DinB
MRDYFTSLARYHAWATDALRQHVAGLSDADYRRDAGLFFKSVHGTCNHLLVAEGRVWLPRFAEGVSNRIALNAEVEPERAAVAARLAELAARWQPLIESLDGKRWAGTLDYTTTQGVPQSLPFAATLGHVFNHASHHRGQITAAITAMGYPCPELDWVRMLQIESRRQGT